MSTQPTNADIRINQLPPDPVGHLRSNIKTRIDSASEETVRMVIRFFNNCDPNLRKPAPAAGWKSIRPIATELGLCPGHLARVCRDIYAAQNLARICTISGRHTWCLSPIAIAQLRATHAPRDSAQSTPSLSGEPALSERHTDISAPVLAEVTDQSDAAPTTRHADTSHVIDQTSTEGSSK